MKKALKIIGIVVGSLSLLLIITLMFLYLYLNETFEFVDAAEKGDIPTMEKMIEEGYNPTETYLGITHLRSYFDHKFSIKDFDNINIDIIKFMLKHKVSPNIKREGDFSILQMSLIFNNDELIKILLEAGADVNYSTSPRYKSLSAVDVAMIFNKYHLLPLLESYGGKPNSIILPEGYATASSCINNPECKVKLTEQHYKIK